jgi:hypothetical protein
MDEKVSILLILLTIIDFSGFVSGLVGGVVIDRFQ